jgi:hypothetical protein
MVKEAPDVESGDKHQEAVPAYSGNSTSFFSRSKRFLKYTVTLLNWPDKSKRYVHLGNTRNNYRVTDAFQAYDANCDRVPLHRLEEVFKVGSLIQADCKLRV